MPVISSKRHTVELKGGGGADVWRSYPIHEHLQKYRPYRLRIETVVSSLTAVSTLVLSTKLNSTSTDQAVGALDDGDQYPVIDTDFSTPEQGAFLVNNAAVTVTFWIYEVVAQT